MTTETAKQKQARLQRERDPRTIWQKNNPWNVSDEDPNIIGKLKSGIRAILPIEPEKNMQELAEFSRFVAPAVGMVNPFAPMQDRLAGWSDVGKAFTAATESPADVKRRMAVANANKPAAAVANRPAPTVAGNSSPSQAFGNSRGDRNNNPGNLEYGPYTKRMGATGSDGRFAIFPSRQMGEAAQQSLLANSYLAKGHDTPAKVIWRYGNDPGPGDDKNVQNYISYVSRKLGIGPNDQIPPQMVPQLAAAMREFETGNTKGGGGVGADIPGVMNPFNPDYGQDALRQLDIAGAAAKKPSSMTFDMPDAPVLADPIMAAPTDFSKVDARLEAMKPIELAERDKIKIQREGFFKGLGEGLSRVAGLQGTGDVLLGLGAAMLRGRSTGDAEVRSKMDEFDDKMAKYNVLMLNNDLTQAKTVRDEAQFSASELNRYAVARHGEAMKQYSENNGMTITADAFITRKTVDGVQTIVRTPIGPVIDSVTAMKKAEILLGRDDREMQGRTVVAQANNGLATAVAAQALSRGGEGAAEAAVLGPALQAVGVIESGAGADVVGEETWGTWQKAATDRAVAAGFQPYSEEAVDYANKYLATELVRAYALDKSGKLREKIGAYGAVGVSVNDAQRYLQRKETTKTDAKGRTSTQSAF